MPFQKTLLLQVCGSQEVRNKEIQVYLFFQLANLLSAHIFAVILFFLLFQGG